MTSPTPDHWSCEAGHCICCNQGTSVPIPGFYAVVNEDGLGGRSNMPMMEFKELDRNKRYEVWLMAVKPEQIYSL